MIFELNLESMKELDDGRLRVAFDQELQHILRDLQDRPGMTQARKLVLTLELKPVIDEQGELDQADIQFQITAKLPGRKTAVYPMKIRTSQRGPMAVFNELSLDNPDQGTLEFDKGD